MNSNGHVDSDLALSNENGKIHNGQGDWEEYCRPHEIT
jgi:hypothetical protein